MKKSIDQIRERQRDGEVRETVAFLQQRDEASSKCRWGAYTLHQAAYEAGKRVEKLSDAVPLFNREVAAHTIIRERTELHERFLVIWQRLAHPPRGKDSISSLLNEVQTFLHDLMRQVDHWQSQYGPFEDESPVNLKTTQNGKPDDPDWNTVAA